MSTSALTVVKTTSTSVLYTQTLRQTEDLHIRVVIRVFVTTPILLMSTLCSILFGVNYVFINHYDFSIPKKITLKSVQGIAKIKLFAVQKRIT